jgi:hypothetical protein
MRHLGPSTPKPPRFTVPELLAQTSIPGNSIVSVEGWLIVSHYLTLMVNKVGDLRGVLIQGNEILRTLLHDRRPTGVPRINGVAFINPTEFDLEDMHSGTLHFILPERLH